MLSLVLVLFSSLGAVGKVYGSHTYCGLGGTYGTASWVPASGAYLSITAVACGVGRGTFTSTHHAVQCNTNNAADWSFGSGSYDFIGTKPNGHTSYSISVSTSGFCPNDSHDWGSTGTYFADTDFTFTATYIPTGQTQTLSTSASDCANSFCPV